MKHFVHLVFAALLIDCVLPQPILAQSHGTDARAEDEQTPLRMRADQVVALINGEIEPEAVFSESFLAAIPAEQFKMISQQLKSQFGAAVSVETLASSNATRAALAIRMERAVARGAIAVTPGDENRISELLFQSFEPTGDNLAKIEGDLAALDGQVSWWFGPLDSSTPPLTSSDADQQMPIGSTFKLYVLATLAREIAEGSRSWSDQVRLEGVRSFPSGMMQNWPENAPATLHTLASLMISISDNTATDRLVDELGREAILETLLASGHSQPELNDPFLKTRELFLLKSGPEARLRAYLNAPSEVKSQSLNGIEDIPIPASQVEAAFAGPPIALDVEWFASANDITNLMRFMRRAADKEAFAIMAINPSIPANLKNNWGYVGYKGGSEPGVLNLSWLLQDGTGQDHALILSWRDDDKRFNPATLELIAQRLLSLDR
jgi:beta-lactamase class A